MKVNVNVLEQLKTHKVLVIDSLLYFAGALLIAIVVCYFIFVSKISAENQKINELQKKMMMYASGPQRQLEQEVFYYKKKVDDFTGIITNHKNFLNIFTFIEENTLPNVSFSSFNISGTKNEVSLLGEAKDMETLSNQVRVLETNKEKIDTINVLNSQTTAQGGVRFTLSLYLNPNIFKDVTSIVP